MFSNSCNDNYFPKSFAISRDLWSLPRSHRRFIVSHSNTRKQEVSKATATILFPFYENGNHLGIPSPSFLAIKLKDMISFTQKYTLLSVPQRAPTIALLISHEIFTANPNPSERLSSNLWNKLHISVLMFYPIKHVIRKHKNFAIKTVN